MPSSKDMSVPLIGIDTNILVRFLVKDDLRDYELATSFFSQLHDPDCVLVNPIVVAELGWVLRLGYHYSAAEVRRMLQSVLSASVFALPASLRLDNNEAWFHTTHDDMADVMIAAINAENGCERTWTFDRKAARNVPGMELLQ